MSAASDRRNARAQALGFTSYSQQYRAKKHGYVAMGGGEKTPGASYNAALGVRRAPGVKRVRTKGALILSAERGDFRQLMREIKRAM